jgi:hypothetical protein
LIAFVVRSKIPAIVTQGTICKDILFCKHTMKDKRRWTMKCRKNPKKKDYMFPENQKTQLIQGIMKDINVEHENTERFKKSGII